jgi:hypothetical protein
MRLTAGGKERDVKSTGRSFVVCDVSKNNDIASKNFDEDTLSNRSEFTSVKHLVKCLWKMNVSKQIEDGLLDIEVAMTELLTEVQTLSKED